MHIVVVQCTFSSLARGPEQKWLGCAHANVRQCSPMMEYLAMNSSSSHPLALAEVLLRDAQVAELSDATRIACAFEAGFRYLQKAAVPLLQSPGLDIQTEAALSNGFERLRCSTDDQRLGRQLLIWFEHRYKLPPLPCSANDAVTWAKRIRRASRAY